MTPSELQTWLQSHEDKIMNFMDYEIYFDDEEGIADTIGMWTENDDWNADGTKLISLGADGTGSIFAVWLKPGTQTGPIVFFGSEGSRGVLAPSPEAWAQVLAYGPGVDEDWDGEETKLDPASNWMFDGDDPETAQEAKELMTEYREDVEEKFDLKPFSELVSGLDPVRIEFKNWLEALLPK